VEEKIEDLPDKIRDTETYQERRQRALDRASFTERLRWKITSVPTERIDDEPSTPGDVYDPTEEF